jgi:hypothetical protein
MADRAEVDSSSLVVFLLNNGLALQAGFAMVHAPYIT